MIATRILSLLAVHYRDGYITPIADYTDAHEAADIERIGDQFEVIETDCRGWGDKNTVIRETEYGSYYLANLSE